MPAPHRVHSDTKIFAMIGSENSAGTGRKGTNLNVRHKMPVKTVADFKLRSGGLPIRHMDISDTAEMKNDNAIQKPTFNQESKALALASNRNLAPHLLLASLLEELCYIYVKDKNKSHLLFKILCERLSKLQVMAPLSHVDEMSGLRYQRRTMLNRIIRAAMKSIEQGPSLLALPDANFGLNLHGPSVKDEDLIEQQTSRYKNEFQEICLLGKGGFGSVFKAKNYLDGREYAVKKVRFKHKNTDLELKLLREVKALANLQHTNIVGYNAAWMEYDSPYLVGKGSPSVDSPRTQDSDSDSTDSSHNQSIHFDTQDSMSIEFCLTDDKSKVDKKKSPDQILPGGFGLAVSAKLFSTVQMQDVICLSDSIGSDFKGSNHKHFSDKHNISYELQSTHFSESILEHSNIYSSVINDAQSMLVQTEVDKQMSAMENMSSLGTSYFKNDYDKQMKSEDVIDFDVKVSTQTRYDTSEKTWAPNPSKSIQSTKVHNHTVYFEGIQEIPSTTACFNNGDGLGVNSRIDSTKFVSSQESSSTLVDDHINVGPTLHSHVHNFCSPEYINNLEDQKCHDPCPNITLPADFMHLCQKAVSSSHFEGLKQSHQNHNNLSIPTSNLVLSLTEMASIKHKINSYTSASQPHNLTDAASQPQNHHPGFSRIQPTPLGQSISKRTVSSFSNNTSNLHHQSGFSQFQFVPSDQMTPEKDTLSSFPNDTLNCKYDTLPFPISDASCNSKLSKLGLYNTVAATLIQDEQPAAENSAHNSSILPILSIGQKIKAKRQTRPLLKIVIPDTSSGHLTFPKSSNSVEHIDKQSLLQKTDLLIERKFQNFTASDAEQVLESQVHNVVFQNSITLYIQMELCTFTLQEWMFERNLEFELKGYDDATIHSDNIRVFHQILQGVDFIHSNGLIHRDLKPRNIFLSGSDLHVKIGDFGLATGDALRPGQEDLVLTPISAVTPLVFDNHTKGVGTSAYASPEQLKGSTYDSKSDIYSLGIMLYEMFYAFNTEMERALEIQKLREDNKCCVSFRIKWSLVADTVEALTDPVACRRPSAQDVLSSQLFLSHEQQVKMLQRKLLQQGKEIDRLQRELADKDKIIAHLRRDERDRMLADDLDDLFG